MARFIIIMALAAITFNKGNLHSFGLSFTSNTIVMQERENAGDIQSHTADAVAGIQNLMLNLFQNDGIAEDASQDKGERVVRCKKAARVVRSS